jgi:hypothetical protein
MKISNDYRDSQILLRSTRWNLGFSGARSEWRGAERALVISLGEKRRAPQVPCGAGLGLDVGGRCPSQNLEDILFLHVLEVS